MILPSLKARFSPDGARCEVKTNGIDWYAGGQCPPYGISRVATISQCLKRVELIMRQLKIPLIMFVCCLLVSCENNPPNPTDTSPVSSPDARSAQPSSPDTSPGESPTVDPSKSTQSAQTQRISAKGIGVAQVGMTLGELKELLGDQAEFQVTSPFMVDFKDTATIRFVEVYCSKDCPVQPLPN
ncbi:MAG: hypothetical protein RIB93_09710 [Coleofasciculus sp. D1-CHI-01]|uniref:hypothetical protein n=1 Tax=Coleofasciculus sp. D1-CHI-01 TaxID=3068482 RepID=UPI0032F5EFAA